MMQTILQRKFLCVRFPPFSPETIILPVHTLSPSKKLETQNIPISNETKE